MPVGFRVSTGATLTITPGTVVKIGGAQGVIDGALVIQGSENAPVTITSLSADPLEQPSYTSFTPWAFDVRAGGSLSITHATLLHVDSISATEPKSISVTNSNITLSHAPSLRETFFSVQYEYHAQDVRGTVTFSKNRVTDTYEWMGMSRTYGQRSFITVRDARSPVDISDNLLTRDFSHETPAADHFIDVSSSSAQVFPPKILGNQMIGTATFAISVLGAIDPTLIANNNISNPEHNGGLFIRSGNDVLKKYSGRLSVNSNLAILLGGIRLGDGSFWELDSSAPIRSLNIETQGSGSLSIRGTVQKPASISGQVNLEIKEGGSLILDHIAYEGCTVADSCPSSRGNELLIDADKAAAISITNSSFNGAVIDTFLLRASNLQSAPVIANNTFNFTILPRGSYYPLYIVNSPISLDDLDGNIVSNADKRENGIYLSGVLTKNGSLPWAKGNMTPVVSGLRIPQGITLSLNPGTLVKKTGNGIVVDGALSSHGTKDNPVVFTAGWDDSLGGDLGWSGGSTGQRNGTHVRVNKYSKADFDHTVFMNADTAVYVEEHTLTHIWNSKFVNTKRAIDATDAKTAYDESSFESKYFQGELSILTSLAGATTNCRPPYWDTTVIMQNNWFGANGVAGVEWDDMPNVTGEIKLTPPKNAESNFETSINLGAALGTAGKAASGDFKALAEDQLKLKIPSGLTDSEKIDWLQAALSLAEANFGKLSIDWVGVLNDITLTEGDNSVPYTDWVCQIAGVPIRTISTPVRSASTLVKHLPQLGIPLPSFPPGFENADLPFLSTDEWLPHSPFRETPALKASPDNNLVALRISGSFPGWSNGRTWTVSPELSTKTSDYYVSVPFEATELQVTPQCDLDCTITGNWQWISASKEFRHKLEVGANVLTLQAKAQDGSTRTYTLTATREPARSNATLSGLHFGNGGTLFPTFSPTVSEYTLVLNGMPNSAGSVPWVLARGDNDATYQAVCQGSRWSSTQAATPAGAILQYYRLEHYCGGTPFSIQATAQDGITTRSYNITVIAPVVYSNAYELTTVGHQLFISGLPVGFTGTYQWLRDGVEIPGAIIATYQVAADDAGKKLSVRVSLPQAGSNPITATSAPVQIAAADPTPSASPTPTSTSPTSDPTSDPTPTTPTPNATPTPAEPRPTTPTPTQPTPTLEPTLSPTPTTPIPTSPTPSFTAIPTPTSNPTSPSSSPTPTTPSVSPTSSAPVASATSTPTIPSPIPTTASSTLPVKEAPKVDMLRIITATVYLKQKSSYQLNVGAYLKNTLTGQKMSYISSNPKVATISTNGKISAKAVKKSTKVVITAKAENKTLRITIWVVPKATTGKATVNMTTSLKQGQASQITVNTGKNTNPKISFTSANQKVATINKYGQIKALKPGTTKITVTVNGKKIVKILKVK